MSGNTTVLNNKRNGLRPTWANIAVVALFAAALSGGVMMVGGYREKVKNLEKDILQVKNWQRDWPSEGELMMDREQNKDLVELFRRINKLEQRAMKVGILE